MIVDRLFAKQRLPGGLAATRVPEATESSSSRASVKAVDAEPVRENASDRMLLPRICVATCTG